MGVNVRQLQLGVRLEPRSAIHERDRGCCQLSSVVIAPTHVRFTIKDTKQMRKHSLAHVERASTLSFRPLLVPRPTAFDFF